jgi:uncharacterized membrane protein
MFETENKSDSRRTISLLLILVGVATVGVDVASILTKKELCPFAGCRLAASSHYSSIVGVPLPLLGMGFFVVALVLVIHRKSLRLWLALGTGFSLYLVMVQLLVLHKICPLCLVVETVTLLLLLVNWSWSDAKLSIPLLIFAFLVSHMLYFPPFGPTVTKASSPTHKKALYKTQRAMLERLFTWRNEKGTNCGKWELFFDLDCPGCASVIDTLSKDVSNRKVEILFRDVLVHKGAFAKSCALVKRLKAGEDIWKLLKELHEAPDNSVPLPDKATQKQVKSLLDWNLKELLSLRGKLVPTLVVTGLNKTCIYEGPKAIKAYLEESKPKGSEALWNFEGPGICTPNKECQ